VISKRTVKYLIGNVVVDDTVIAFIQKGVYGYDNLRFRRTTNIQLMLNDYRTSILSNQSSMDYVGSACML